MSRWLYNLHNRVNKKIDVHYGVSYEDVKNRYESYRAKCTKSQDAKGCVVPLEVNSFKVASIKDCPVISKELAKKFVPLSSHIEDKYKDFLEVTKDSEKWELRNKLSSEIINKMRTENINPLKENGLPSDDELRLIMMLSSNLSIDELEKLVPLIGGFKIKKYKLIR